MLSPFYLFNLLEYSCFKGVPRWLSGRESVCQCRNRRRHKRRGFDPWVGKIPWRREWLPTPVFLPGESHGWRSLEGYSAWGHKESDTTEWLTLFYLFCASYQMCIYVNPSLPISSRRPSPPWCPYICPLCLCLCFCFAKRSSLPFF